LVPLGEEEKRTQTKEAEKGGGEMATWSRRNNSKPSVLRGNRGKKKYGC